MVQLGRPGKPTPPNDLPARINAAHQACVGKMTEGLAHAIEAGKLLLEAKTMVTHGDWLPWVREHCLFSGRTAQGYMKVARNTVEVLGSNPQRVADLPFREALAGLSIPRKRPGRTEDRPATDGGHLDREEEMLPEETERPPVAVVQGPSPDPVLSRAFSRIDKFLKTLNDEAPGGAIGLRFTDYMHRYLNELSGVPDSRSPEDPNFNKYKADPREPSRPEENEYNVKTMIKIDKFIESAILKKPAELHTALIAHFRRRLPPRSPTLWDAIGDLVDAVNEVYKKCPMGYRKAIAAKLIDMGEELLERGEVRP